MQPPYLSTCPSEGQVPPESSFAYIFPAQLAHLFFTAGDLLFSESSFLGCIGLAGLYFRDGAPPDRKLLSKLLAGLADPIR